MPNNELHLTAAALRFPRVQRLTSRRPRGREWTFKPIPETRPRVIIGEGKRPATESRASSVRALEPLLLELLDEIGPLLFRHTCELRPHPRVFSGELRRLPGRSQPHVRPEDEPTRQGDQGEDDGD